MFGRGKIKIKAIFLKPLGENNFEEHATKKIMLNKSFNILKTKGVKTTDETISFEDKTFPLPKKGIFTLKRGNTLEVYYDYENEKILCFKEHGILVSAEFLDKLLSKKIIAQLISKLRSGMEKATNRTLLQFLFVGGIMFAVGFMLKAMM